MEEIAKKKRQILRIKRGKIKGIKDNTIEEKWKK